MATPTKEVSEEEVRIEDASGIDVCRGVSCTKSGLIGDYDWRWLCTPSLPFGGKPLKPPLFLYKDDRLPLMVSVLMGFQHALASIGGIITVPALIAGDACFPWQFDAELCGARQYLISAGLVVSGILTVIQVLRFHLRGNYYLGTGLVSVMGTSFTFLPLYRAVVSSEIRAGNSGVEAYGALLGTSMVAAIVEVIISFCPPKTMRRIVPPLVSGVCVTLIGAGLVAAGIKYWGGGVFCAENDLSRAVTFGGPQLCTGNGEVVLGYGAPAYIGLGSVVLLALVVIQMVGSPFMKNCAVIIALFVGYVIAAAVPFTTPSGERLSFVTAAKIREAPWVTFPWVTTFPLGFYPAAFIPILLGYVISSIETMGDIVASCEASRVTKSTTDTASRIQGGLLADGLNSIVACLMTTPPNTTFSQNNGVIALTRVASRAAGLACAGWLFFLGVFGKFAGVISSIPDAVLGGMTLFLFANVLVGGISIIASMGKIDRRSRFILAISLGVGLGVTCLPSWAEGGGVSAFYGANLQHNYGLIPGRSVCKTFPTKEFVVEPQECRFYDHERKERVTRTDIGESLCKKIDGSYTAAVTETREVRTCVDDNGTCCLEYDQSTKMWRDSLILILKTPYCIGTLLALILNAILPHEEDDEEEDGPALTKSSESGSTGNADVKK